MPIVETFRGVKAGSIKPLLARYWESAGKFAASIAMSWRFLAAVESPSHVTIWTLGDGNLNSSPDQQKGSEMGHSFFAGLASLLGGDGDVGGDEVSLVLALCRLSIF